MANIQLLQPLFLTDSSGSTPASAHAAGPAPASASNQFPALQAAAAATEGVANNNKLLFLKLLRSLLEVDSAAALNSGHRNSGMLIKAYISCLAVQKKDDAPVRIQALQLLPLLLPSIQCEEHMNQVTAAVMKLADQFLSGRTHKMYRYSAEAIAHTSQVMAIIESVLCRGIVHISQVIIVIDTNRAPTDLNPVPAPTPHWLGRYSAEAIAHISQVMAIIGTVMAIIDTDRALTYVTPFTPSTPLMLARYSAEAIAHTSQVMAIIESVSVLTYCAPLSTPKLHLHARYSAEALFTSAKYSAEAIAHISQVMAIIETVSALCRIQPHPHLKPSGGSAQGPQSAPELDAICPTAARQFLDAPELVAIRSAAARQLLDALLPVFQELAIGSEHQIQE
eukprot:gene11147-18767_t